MNSFTLGKITFDNLSFDEAVDSILQLSRQRPGSYVVTPNVDHVVRAETDPHFLDVIENSDLVCVDGMPIVWASYLLGSPVKGKVSGSDLVHGICARAAQTGHRIFLLGGLQGEALRAQANLEKAYPGLGVAGTYFPPFGFERDPVENRKILQQIKESGADVILVGVGSPKQEQWIAAHRHELGSAKTGVFIGVGISIAFCAGTVQRAPRFMQRLGLEWIYRIYREPRRLLLRYVKDFYIIVIFLRTFAARLTTKEPMPL
jgi:N-acetylglucosaminyldiphosphoundecaprenol N-acetyl-beta-D-mannosaminyltransferase